MTDDIVERIDEWVKGDDTEWQDELLRDAKAEIERLRKVEEHHDQAIERAERLEAEIERLRKQQRGELHCVHAHLQHMRNETARLRAALLTCPCPAGGFGGMPKDAEPTVALCLQFGVCGCCYGDALGATTS